MVVIDVGSNIGYYALLEARLVGASGQVIAIEPVPQNAAVLRENVQLNQRGNIAIHEMAIADHNGESPIYLSPKSNWHSLLPLASRPTIMVTVSTLDRLVASARLPSVDLIRMDVEGYEIQILSGMRDTLRRYGPRLLIELHPDLVSREAMQGYLRTLQNFGYAPEWALEQERDYPIRWKCAKPEHPTMRELMLRMLADLRAMTVLFVRATDTTNELQHALTACVSDGE
jgi:FkbM family methyltransferase